MPHYHFHTLHGRLFRDVEGEDLVDAAAARRHTLRVMGEILRDGATGFWDAGPFRVLCTDADGAVVTGLVAEQLRLVDAVRMMADIEANDPRD
ncbi:MAG: hypothetical protein EOP20_12790 [Hyphomicrobiales bacterium]|nr:MAG: hypothetical protein EOP20_12790 [Hyphomicrobiales bacterium]